MPIRFEDIGNRLKAFRLGSGLSADEIASRLGISRTALYRFEKGELAKIETLEKLSELLGVDAIVRMQIRKKRYMSDYASYGVTIARHVIKQTPLGNKLPIPGRLGKTEDIYAYCSVVSNSITLWNNNYKAAADWDNPSTEIIENITDNFGRYFPYKKRK